MTDVAVPTQEEKNAAIAKWMGWKHETRVFNMYENEGDTETVPYTLGPYWWPPNSGCNAPACPDFFASEHYSAQLRDHIAHLTQFCCVELVYDGFADRWNFQLKLVDHADDEHEYLQPNYSWIDARTAIAEAGFMLATNAYRKHR